MRMLAILSVVGSLAAHGVIAQVGETDGDIDTDGDGMYSCAELDEFHPRMEEADFTKADLNGDGFLDQEEYETGLTEAQREVQD
jgi:hypothetical protein